MFFSEEPLHIIVQIARFSPGNSPSSCRVVGELWSYSTGY